MLLFMFDFNKSVHSYETRSSQMFHIPKEKTLRFGLNTLSYDGAKLWNKIFHVFLHKESDLVDHLVVFVVYNSAAGKSLWFKLNIDRILIP